MPSSKSESPRKESAAAVEHVTGAHELLKTLQKKVGEHPELAEAIRKLETALNILTVKTGGML